MAVVGCRCALFPLLPLVPRWLEGCGPETQRHADSTTKSALLRSGAGWACTIGFFALGGHGNPGAVGAETFFVCVSPRDFSESPPLSAVCVPRTCGMRVSIIHSFSVAFCCRGVSFFGVVALPHALCV